MRVGAGPIGIAWDPGNEEILGYEQLESRVSVVSAFTFQGRDWLRSQLNGPFEVPMTPRQVGFGFLRTVDLGYVLSSDGAIAIIESGPDGVSGWGFDDVVGTPPFTLFNPKAIQPDPPKLNTAAIRGAHEPPLDPNGNPTGERGRAITQMELRGGTLGLIPLGVLSNHPSIRDLPFGVVAPIGASQLTGIPVDLCFENQRRQTSLTNLSSSYAADAPLPTEGKAIVKGGARLGPVGTANRTFLFAAVPISTRGGRGGGRDEPVLGLPALRYEPLPAGGPVHPGPQQHRPDGRSEAIGPGRASC